MNKYLQQFLIISSIFLIILWFQSQDDKKHDKKRTSIYDTYKFPVLVSASVGLALNLCNIIKKEESTFLPVEVKKYDKYNLMVDTGSFRN